MEFGVSRRRVNTVCRLAEELFHEAIANDRGRTELDVSQETYYQILNDKTASLFAFAAGCGARLAGADEASEKALKTFGEKLGIAFQLIDDVLDYQGEQSGKTLFADLIEGKLTLPLVLAIEKERSLAE